jgi:hypothetical protein
MNKAQPTSGKILCGTEGLGTVTPQMVEQRAREIARSDGRSQSNELAWTRAREELTGSYSRFGGAPDQGGTGSRLANATGVDRRESSDRAT